jgi:hypothetical protein
VPSTDDVVLTDAAAARFRVATDVLTTLNGTATVADADGNLPEAQRVKPGFGPDGSLRDVDASNGLPVSVVSSGGPAATSGTITAAATSTTAGTTSNSAIVVFDVSMAGNVSFHLLATAFQGTVVFEQSFDPAGATGTWAQIPVIPEDVTTAPFGSLFINPSIIRQFSQSMWGPSLFRVRCSGYTSGSLGVLGKAGPGWYEGQPSLAPSAALIGDVRPAPAATSPITAPAASATSATLLAANTARLGVLLTNDATGTLYLAFGAVTASATNHTVQIPAGGYWELPSTGYRFTGALSGVWAAGATGNARITEIAP